MVKFVRFQVFVRDATTIVSVATDRIEIHLAFGVATRPTPIRAMTIKNNKQYFKQSTH